jgi:regulator of replication initiation timing
MITRDKSEIFEENIILKLENEKLGDLIINL